MLRFALASFALAACAAPTTDSTMTRAAAPLTTGGADAADHACTVIMRMGLPIEANGWQATIEVSAAAAGTIPALLWRRPGQAWQSTPGFALDDGNTTPGYTRYAVTIDVLEQPFEAVPYVPLANGGRMFDHNRNRGDFDNYEIAAPDYSIWTAPATCPATATLTFAADYTQTQSGPIAPGGQLHLDYAMSRLHACAAANLTAHLRFAPNGEALDSNVNAASATVTVPTGANRVTIWFDATNTSGCHAWDSAYGANYVFAIAAP